MTWLTILPNLNIFCHMVSEASCYITLKSYNSHKVCWIKMATQQAHLHVMTNNPTKYEQISTERFQRSYVHKVSQTDRQRSLLCPSVAGNKYLILNLHSIFKSVHNRKQIKKSFDVKGDKQVINTITCPTKLSIVLSTFSNVG